jgi:hypothetical protein
LGIVLGEILVILLIAVAAMVAAFLKSAEVRAATRNEPERDHAPEDEGRDPSG